MKNLKRLAVVVAMATCVATFAVGCGKSAEAENTVTTQDAASKREAYRQEKASIDASKAAEAESKTEAK